jgi:hypothetical protein
MAVETDVQEDGVRAPETGTSAPDTWFVPRLARGYPPVLAAMLLIDAVACLVTGHRARLSLGEVVAYALLPPLAMLLIGLPTTGARSRVPLLAGAGAAAAALLAALFLGGAVRLFSVSAWAEAAVGVVLLGVTALLFAPRRQHVGRRRA